MADVKSKNLYELLGNDSDQDSDREAPEPIKVVDKPTARTGKRDAPKEAPVVPQGDNAARGGRGGKRAGPRGNEGAYQEGYAGRNANRGTPVGAEDGDKAGRNSDRGTRGTRGNRGPRRGGDRHSRTGITEHTKQTDQGWGAPTGNAEWGDEKAGQDIATQEIKEGGWDAEAEAPGFKDVAAPTDNGAPSSTDAAPEGGAPEPVEPAEPEDTHKSYADYLAEQATKKMAALGVLEPRQANEGSKQDKKWQNAKELTKSGDDEAYFEGAGEKARRERDRQRNAKEKLDLDYSFKEPSRGGERGGRGRGRGDRGDRGGRGRGRGDFGDRGDREGGYRGRGDGFRGRGERGDRGEYRGRGRGRGRGESGEGPAVELSDENAFPSLGGGKK